MSISGISSISSGSTQSTKKGNGGPPPEIQAELQKYGLTAQGSYQADMAAINAAKAAQQGQNGEGAQGGKGKKGPGGPPPEIMQQLQQYGLQPQGSLQADLAAINAAKAEQSQNSGQTNPIAQMMEMLTGNNSGSSSNSLTSLLGNTGGQTKLSFLA
ncbi:MAG: hypothetical protein AB7V50_06950 [Vampirovibrionia bacterium]